MTDSQKLKIGVALLVVQLCLVALTMGFKATMDHQAERAGIAAIIQEATR
jgi:hypothetical protein